MKNNWLLKGCIIQYSVSSTGYLVQRINEINEFLGIKSLLFLRANESIDCTKIAIELIRLFREFAVLHIKYI
jgi:hypothetical protein